MTTAAPSRQEQIRERLKTDTPFYARNCLYIVNGSGQIVPLEPRPGQLKLDAALESQRELGQPMRVINLKARKIGFCLAPETRVLTADLRWVAIADLRDGEEIIGTDDEIPGAGQSRKMRRAVVEAKREVHEPAFRLILDNGQTLVATAQHRFLCRRRGGPEMGWRTVGEMEPGDLIRHITKPWDAAGYEEGWMGGLLDGEGCLRAKVPGGVELTISQVPGSVYDRARAFLVARGFTFREDVDRREAKPGGKFASTEVNKLVLHRTNELFHLLGLTRPSRLARSDWWEGRDLPGKRSGIAVAAVLSIEPLGEQRMIDLQTSTGTFIAEGFVSHNSTWTQGKMIQRTTQRPNHRALVVAQDRKTGGELFAIGETMYAYLPVPPMVPEDWQVKPPLANQRRSSELFFGEEGRRSRALGHLGLNSSLRVDTAGEFEAGRGFTLHSLHVSEIAFWPNITRKLTSLLNAVPDEPETMVVIESTANGHNHFKTLWDAAEAGESDYIPVFVGWHEEPSYMKPFLTEMEREEFIATIGTGPYGEDEPDLQARFGCTPEQLNWRRHAIRNRAQGDLRIFHQEFPAEPDEAFLATGRQVFSTAIVSRIISELREDPPEAEHGSLNPTGWFTKKTRGGDVQVPTGVELAESPDDPARVAKWTFYEHPITEATEDRKVGQYIVAADVAGGEEDETGQSAWHALQVIDHRTRIQVAEYRSRIDPDLFSLEAYLVALYYNRAWLAVETTGGWGAPIARRVWREYGYNRMYFRKSLERKKEKQEDRLGWDTNRVTKQFLESTATELLREGSHGIRSIDLSREMLTYVRNARGGTGPESGKFSDLLMAWMIGQQVAGEIPLRPERRPGELVSAAGRAIRDTVTGY